MYSYLVLKSLVCGFTMNRYVTRMSFVCARMSSVRHSDVLVCYPYVIRMSLVCTRMPHVCNTYVLVCRPFVTRLWFYHGPSTYEYIRMTYGWHTSTFEWHSDGNDIHRCEWFLITRCMLKIVSTLLYDKIQGSRQPK